MRKLKLQMHISLDGFVTDNGGANFNWDKEVRDFSIANLKNVDSILLGKNTAKGFIPHWSKVAKKPKDSDYKIGKLLTDIPKVVFSHKLKAGKLENATIAKGNIAKQIKALKKKKGKDMIVYGGYRFVTSLIEHKLIDEFYFLLNPIAFGSGDPIFNTLKNGLQLTLKESKPFACGTVLLKYVRKK